MSLSQVNTLWREPRVEHTCLKSQISGSAYHMVTVTPFGTVRSSVL